MSSSDDSERGIGPRSGRGIARSRAEHPSWAGPFARGELLEGKYEITAVLGAGGMGVVYEAQDRLLNRAVAVKVPLREELSASLVREAQAMAAIVHPSLVTIHALGHHRQTDYLVMERVYGMTVEDRVIEAGRANRPIPLAEALDVLIAVAGALIAIHRAGVAHRDIKSANVMLTGSRIVLTDFGLVTPEVAVAAGAPIAGSADYMAPELILGTVRQGHGPAVDIYALGVMAYELLAGARPYPAPNFQAVLMAQIQRPVPDVRDLRREVPDDLAQLLREMMAKSPADRPESVEMICWRLTAIREAVSSLPGAELCTVLVVDDDPTVGATLSRDLTWSLPRIAVESITDAEAAIDRVRRSPPRLVLVDLDMGGMNGVELCMAFRAMPGPEHPSIVAIGAEASEADLGVLRSLGMMVMERVYGMTVEDRVIEAGRANRPIPLAEALDVLIAVAGALIAIHRAGVAHRDIKSANVMLTGSRIVLTDFGLVTPEVAVAAGAPIAGSADYMAPELILGTVRQGHGPAVDIYALGVMAYELLAGARPYPAPNFQAVLMAQIQRPVPDVRDLRREVPDDLAQLLREMMAKSPADRPESVEMICWRLTAIREAVSSLPGAELCTVLVVDDDPTVGATLSRDLTWSLPRIAVESITDAEAAIDRVRRSPPRLVLVDLDMGGMNGVELCMAFRAMPGPEHPSIVAIGAEASEADLGVLRSLGMTAFVAKDHRFTARVAEVIAEMRRAPESGATSRRTGRPVSNRPGATTLRSRPR